MRAATPLLLALLLSACSPLVAQPAQTAGGSIQELTRQIDAEIGTPRCSADAQCRTLAVGARACGGPDAYRPYAVPPANAQRLEKLAQQQAELQRNAQQNDGRMSICSLLTDPGARCEKATQRCVLRTDGAGGGVAQ
jgi:hypothetical protein